MAIVSSIQVQLSPVRTMAVSLGTKVCVLIIKEEIAVIPERFTVLLYTMNAEDDYGQEAALPHVLPSCTVYSPAV